MSSGSIGPRFPVRVDDAVLDEDISHATPAGRTAIRRALRDFVQEGLRVDWLKRCQPDHRDGTDLPGCVKVYIPPPNGRWGAVFVADLASDRPVLVLLAVGQRHPMQPWAPSVYQVAHRRLHS